MKKQTKLIPTNRTQSKRPALRLAFKMAMAGNLLALLLLAPRGASRADTLFVANTGSQNIMEFDPSGAGKAFASTSGYYPRGLAFDSAGNLYASFDLARASFYIYEYNSSGIGKLFATRVSGSPRGMVFDSAGNLLVALGDAPSIVKFNSSGVGTVFASTGLNSPVGLAFDSEGNLYVSDSGNNNIMKFNSSGVGTVFASSGMSSPRELAFDRAGNLYVASYANNTIMKYNSSGVGTVFASSGLNHPHGLAIDSAGNLYVGNEANSSIMKFNSSGVGAVFASSGMYLPEGMVFFHGVSATLSTVTVSPSSAPADGATAITATVTLRDNFNNAVPGHNITFYAQGSPINISQPTTPTDANGQASALLTSLTPCTASVHAFDTTTPRIIPPGSPPVVVFTNRTLVAPNTDLQNAIASLYKSSADNLYLGGAPIATELTLAASYGSKFRSNITGDEAKGAFDLLMASIDVGLGAGQATTYAKDLLNPGLREAGTGLLEDAKLSALLDTELLNNDVSLRVFDSAVFQVAKSAKVAVLENTFSEVFDALGQALATASDGLPSGAALARANCSYLQQELETKQQALLSTGIPPLSAGNQTAWALDLNARLGVGAVLSEMLAYQNHCLNLFSQARDVAPENALWCAGAQLAVEGTAHVFFDGPGDILAGGTFAIANQIADKRKQTGDQMGFNYAIGNYGGCIQAANQIFENGYNAYEQISLAKTPNTVTGQLGPISDCQQGYDSAWWFNYFVPTNAFSLYYITNTSPEAATFEVFVQSSYSCSAFAVTIPDFPLISRNTVTIPANGVAQIRVTYWDGRNGGQPNPSSEMYHWVIGNNASGTFYVGEDRHTWSPARAPYGNVTPSGPGVTPMDATPEIENPVRSYVWSNPTNQCYEAEILLVNPLSRASSAVVTQALPQGITLLTTDGTIMGSSIVWTNVFSTGSVVRNSFTFQAPFAPNIVTNLPVPIVVFIDPTNNQSSPFYPTLAGFAGVFPVQVTGAIPKGVSGVNVPMQIIITNWTSISQTGTMTVSLTNSSGQQVLGLSQGFALGGSGSTVLIFSLPGTLPPGQYALTTALSVAGGSGSVLNGIFTVPVAPLVLELNPIAPWTTNGLNLVLHGQVSSNAVIMASSDLVTWVPINYFSITNSPYYLTDTSAKDYGRRFYRALIP